MLAWRGLFSRASKIFRRACATQAHSNDPAIAPRAHCLYSRVAVGHETAGKAIQKEHRPIPMATDREVKHIDRRRDAPIDPHPRRNAATRLRLRCRDHLAGANVLRIVSITGWWRVFWKECHCRFVGADDRSRQHHLPEVRYQWRDQACCEADRHAPVA